MNRFSRNQAMPSLSKPRQLFLYIAPFLGLASFKVWASLGREPHSLLIAAAVVLVYSLSVLALALKWDKPTYFDWTACGYFFLVTLSLALWPEATGAILSEYAVTGIYLCLFAAAFFPPMLGMDPFTYHYAKKYAPKEVWSSSIFVRINRIMTFVWAGIFAICVLMSLYPSVITRAVIPITMIVGTALSFNRRFPRYYLSRLGLSPLGTVRGSPFYSASDSGHSANSGPASHAAVKPPDLSSPNQHGSASNQGTATSTNQSQLTRRSTMKVIAINSSPRAAGTSKTRLLLEALTAGMREAGADVETVHLREKKIKNCIGCYTCWTKTPGVCVQKDDMTNEVFPQWLEADLAVYATPLYHYTVNATMKAFIERTLPIVEPFLVRGEGKTSHPLRQTPPRAVVLSVAGFPEPTVFAQLSSYVNFLFGKGLVAEIYRPAAETMTLPHLTEAREAILAATADAGRELVNSMTISQATMERITRTVVDSDSMAQMANLFWKSCIREGVTPREFFERNLIPRPDDGE